MDGNVPKRDDDEPIHQTLLASATSGARTAEAIQSADDLFRNPNVDQGLFTTTPMVAANRATENEAAWGVVNKGITLVNPSPSLIEEYYAETYASPLRSCCAIRT